MNNKLEYLNKFLNKPITINFVFWLSEHIGEYKPVNGDSVECFEAYNKIMVFLHNTRGY